jgi:hypothetical protein
MSILQKATTLKSDENKKSLKIPKGNQKELLRYQKAIRRNY